MSNSKILYIGRFELPDKEATANRVMANAKLLRDLGYETVLAGWSDDVPRDLKWIKNEYFGFSCYEKHKAHSSYEKFRMFSDADAEIRLLQSEHFDIVIAYDFPAVALKKIMRYCQKHAILCLCDVSEWYTNKNKNPLFRIVRAYDSYLRMKVLHKKSDGLIVISKFLKDYYNGLCMTEIPPLVDKQEAKWNVKKRSDDGKIHLTYAGWPSKTKERLDLLVKAVSHLSVSGKYPLILDVYGINEAKYREIYGISEDSPLPNVIVFHGRVSHHEALQGVKNADFSLIIRESNRKNNAGFPSKLVESISCGTPVLTTPISNVRDYVGDGKNGFIVSIDTLEQDMEKALLNRQNVAVDENTFDYRNFITPMKEFLARVSK